jgi:flagellar basal-body rod protein FlgB
MINRFERTIDLLHRGMDVASLRQSVSANNIANSGVPNFKRSEVNFESALKKALDSEKRRPALELNLTDPKHIPNWKVTDYRDVKPRRTLDYLTTSKANGSNVDIETEVQTLVQNQLMYNLLAQATAFEFSQVNSVLRG